MQAYERRKISLLTKCRYTNKADYALLERIAKASHQEEKEPS
jgi:hypothetical protein